MKSAVAFIVFNRPECTARTLAAIREARPPRLLVIADGPREHRQDDTEKCSAVRKLINDGIDWPCQVELNYEVQNMGCAARVSSGLTWAFSRSEALIVIEDDCLPAPSFFWFCDELLEKYAADARVGQICGCLRYFDQIERPTSYIFSRYGPIWGWASWRRAWASYDLRIASWPKLRASGGLRSVTQGEAEMALRTSLYDRLHNHAPDTWDFQWGYAKLSQGMMSVMPCKNLVENIEFGADGTHTTSNDEGGLKRLRVDAPLVHPEFVLPDLDFDRAYAGRFTSEGSPSIWRRAVRKFRKITTPSRRPVMR